MQTQWHMQIDAIYFSSKASHHAARSTNNIFKLKTQLDFYVATKHPPSVTKNLEIQTLKVPSGVQPCQENLMPL